MGEEVGLVRVVVKVLREMLSLKVRRSTRKTLRGAGIKLGLSDYFLYVLCRALPLSCGRSADGKGVQRSEGCKGRRWGETGGRSRFYASIAVRTRNVSDLDAM